jgi:hypothetical protein
MRQGLAESGLKIRTTGEPTRQPVGELMTFEVFYADN